MAFEAARRIVEIALHGNWVAIDARGRAIVAQALFTSLGGGTEIPSPLHLLAPADDLRRAITWGLSMRLGQRLSGGLAGPLRRSRLTDDGEIVTLHVTPDDLALYGEAVERRHAALCTALGRKPIVTA